MILSTSGIVLTGLTIVSVVLYQSRTLDEQVVAEMNDQARSECSKIAKDVYLMLRAHDDQSKKTARTDLAVVHDLLACAGGVSFSQETVNWDATNQLTKQTRQVVLPKMLLGKEWLGQNRDSSVSSPLVDKLQSLVGSTCTIFQRMNDAGDMLRVCTNVKKEDGSRAIGTYIPATNPDGSPNPVVGTVLRGETFVGRAFVVNAWYSAAYEPVLDAQKRVIGVLYCGVKQDELGELRQSITEIVVGKTGYVYILNGTGEEKGRYVVSYKGQRDGENIWDATDTDGNRFVQSIITKALATKNGECDFDRYPWRNSGEDHVRWKLATVTYFQPWDWVIGVGAYEDDYHIARARVASAMHGMIFLSVFAAAAAFVLCGGIAWGVARRITNPLVRAVTTMEAVAAGDFTKRLEVSGTDEIGRMTASVNVTLDALTKPLTVAAEYVHQISRGDIPERITDTFNGAVCNEIKNNLNQCIDALNGLMDEMNHMSREHDAGDIDVAVSADKFQGAYRKMAEGVNKMVQGHIAVKKKAMACIAEFGNGNFEAPLEKFPGKKVFINETIEQVRTNLKAVIQETNTLIQATQDGKLQTRGNAQRFAGDWGKLVGSVNKLIDALVAPINVTAEYVDRLSKGDIPPKITDTYNGDFNEIKNNLNQCIEVLGNLIAAIHHLAEEQRMGAYDVLIPVDKFTGAYRTVVEGVNLSVQIHVNNILAILNILASYADGDFAPVLEKLPGKQVLANEKMDLLRDSLLGVMAETTTLIQATRDGKLQTRGNAKRFAGGWGELVGGVNDLIDAFVAPINVTAEYVDRISKGDIPPKITDTYYGDFNEIKNNLNSCIDSMNGVIDGMTRMYEAQKVGDIDAIVETTKFTGVYRQMAEGVNAAVQLIVNNTLAILNVLGSYAEGDFTPVLQRLPGKQVIANERMDLLRSNLLHILGDVESLAKAAVAGELDTRADAASYRNKFREILEGMNATLGGVVTPIRDISEVLKRMANKDFTACVTRKYPGAYGVLSDDVNLVVANVRAAIEQITESANQFAEGSHTIAESAKRWPRGLKPKAPACSRLRPRPRN